MSILEIPLLLARDGWSLAQRFAGGLEELWARPSSPRRQLAFGVIGTVLALALVVASSVIAVNPLGKTEVVADFPESGMIRPGDDVRVQGVSVGTVESLDLRRDHVRVRLRVDRNVHIGNQSTVAVKMLTGVGGYFVDIDSIGREAIGDEVIPPSRVRIPYSLVSTFQEAEPKIRAIDPAPLRESLAEIGRSTAGNSGQLKGLIGSLSNVVQSLTRQKQEVGGFIRTLSEYSATVDRNGDLLTGIMRDLDVYFTTANLNVAGYQRFMKAMDLVLRRLDPVATFYQQNLASMELQFHHISGQIGELLQQFQPMIDNGMAMLKKLESSVHKDGSIAIDGSSGFLGSSICIPIEGVTC